MVPNGRLTTRQLIEQLARQEREAAARAERARQAEARLRLSAMTPAQKSAFLRSRIAAGRTGPEAQADYMRLPWS